MTPMIAVYFTLLVGLVNTHQRAARNYRGLSQGFGIAMNLSVIAGGLTALGLAIWTGFVLAWYSPFLLIVLAGILGGIVFAAFDAALGDLPMRLVGFLWPVPAYLMFQALSAASVA